MAKQRAYRLHNKDTKDAFSRYIRKRDSLETTGDIEYCICCTCGEVRSTFHGTNCIQAGHFIHTHLSVRFDERNVHAQCAKCNKWGKGEPIKYTLFMLKKYGQDVIDELEERKHQVVKFTRSDLDEIRDKYKKKFEEL